MKKPIRTGCYIKWESPDGIQLAGEVVSHHYNEKGHQFEIKLAHGPHFYSTGAHLYSNLIFHKPGEASRKELKKSMKRERKRAKREKREFLKARRPKNML